MLYQQKRQTRDESVSKQKQEIIIMKKTVITSIVAVSIIIGFTAIHASAWGWGHRGPMMGPGYGMMYDNGANDAESQKFFDETKDIRIQIAADRAELNALMAGDNPDSKRVRELSESIATKQITLQEKSRDYDWGNGSANRSFGRGPGMMGGGYGPCNW